MAATKTRATAARKNAVVVDEGAKGGFTIIEVVLVLAIAGLIFLMVFLALPALQRSQRDSERQRALGNVTAQIQKYQQNNRGQLPADSQEVPAREGGDELDLDSTWPCSSTTPVTAGTAGPANCFIRNYMNGADAQFNEWIDPTGYSYGLHIQTLTSGSSMMLGNADYADHIVYILKHARCDGEQAVYSSNSRDFVVMYKLEGAGTYCS